MDGIVVNVEFATLSREEIITDGREHLAKQLYNHQEAMLKHHLNCPHSFDLSEVGTGKSAPCILWLDQLFKNQSISKALIVCPLSVIDHWLNEISSWSKIKAIALRGPKTKRISALQEGAQVFLINYEATRILLPQLTAAKIDAIVCDEAVHIKSYRSLQSRALHSLAKFARYRTALTGTLITNSLLDVWSVAHFVNPDILKMNYFGFRNVFFYNENANKAWLQFPKYVPKNGAIEEVKKRLAPYAIRFEKRAVLKFLPPLTFQKRTVELAGEQLRVYRELKKHFVAELDNSSEPLAALQILGRIAKLAQITSGFCYREGELPYHFRENPKLDVLKEILEELGDSRAILWIAFKEDVKILARFLPEGSFAVIEGDTPPLNRQPLIDRFNANEFRYLICNTACASEGLTILAGWAIYFSRNWRLGDRVQSLGRNDRPGAEQFSNLCVIDIVANGTVDEKVMAALESKANLLDTLNPKTAREWLQ